MFLTPDACLLRQSKGYNQIRAVYVKINALLTGVGSVLEFFLPDLFINIGNL
jgi:hypothetical protein